MKVGDRVKIREWDDMKKEFGLDFVGDINCSESFTTCMKPLCGKVFTVTYVDDVGNTRLDDWIISNDMLIVLDNVEKCTENDPVNHPSHYTNGGMECIDEMEKVFGTEVVMNFCICNVWKYRKRAMYKNGEEDMKKADWYMNKYAELKEKIDA